MSEQLTLFDDILPPEEKIVRQRVRNYGIIWYSIETAGYYTHLDPKNFADQIGQNEDTICSKIKRGQIKAIDLNIGGQKARYAIPKAELDKFNPEEYRGVYKHLRD